MPRRAEVQRNDIADPAPQGYAVFASYRGATGGKGVERVGGVFQTRAEAVTVAQGVTRDDVTEILVVALLDRGTSARTVTWQ